MELLETAKKRFSVRSYTDQKVEPEKLNKILEAAHVAPDSSQPSTGSSNCSPKR